MEQKSRRPEPSEISLYLLAASPWVRGKLKSLRHERPTELGQLQNHHELQVRPRSEALEL